MKKTIVTSLLEKLPDSGVDIPEEEIFVNREEEPQYGVNGNLAEVTETFNVCQVSPIGVNFGSSPKGEDILILYMLCKDSNTKKLFTLISNYYIDNEDDRHSVYNNIINKYLDTEPKRLVFNMVMNNNPCYITDMYYYKNQDSDDPNEVFYMMAVSNKDEKNIVKLNMSADVFSSIAFIDDYIMSMSNNIHDLQQAIVSGYVADLSVTPMYFVKDIENIVSLGADKNESSNNTDVAVIFNIKADDDNSYTVLGSFGVETKYDKKKMAKFKIAEIESRYGTDVNQYVFNYILDTYITNLDKYYMVIKVNNHNGINKLFFLDEDNITKLYNMINERLIG